MASARDCMLCNDRPREVRLQCGHLFGCAKCVAVLTTCAICREPIYASYDIRRMASEARRGCRRGLSGTATGASTLSGYVSSGSESFTDIAQKPCFGCCEPGTLLFNCPHCVSTQMVLCVKCASSWQCLECKNASKTENFTELSNSVSSPSSCKSSDNGDHTQSAIAPMTLEPDPPATPHGDMRAPSKVHTTDGIPVSAASKEAKVLSGKFSGDTAEAKTVQPTPVNPAVQRLAEVCATVNTIVELSEDLNRMQLAAAVGGLCLQKCMRRRKAVIIAPTVPLVRKHLDIVRQVSPHHADCIIGTATVDAWDREQWQKHVSPIDVLITTPQLFLDSLNAHFVDLNAFCVMVVDECQHCSGSHPFAMTFKDHYHQQQQLGCDIRVLGLCKRLMKSKMKGSLADRQSVVRKFETLMDSQLLDQSALLQEVPVYLSPLLHRLSSAATQ